MQKEEEEEEEEQTCALKNDISKLVNFDLTLKSLKFCTLMHSFWPKHIPIELKKSTEELCIIILNIDVNFGWNEEFGELHQSIQIS